MEKNSQRDPKAKKLYYYIYFLFSKFKPKNIRGWKISCLYKTVPYKTFQYKTVQKNIAKYKKTVPYKTVPKIVQKIVQKIVPLIEVIIVLEADK